MIPQSIHDEISSYTGKLFKGDPTPLVFEMFKNSEDVPSLLKILKGGDNDDVSDNIQSTVVREEGSHRLSVKEWLVGCERL